MYHFKQNYASFNYPWEQQSLADRVALLTNKKNKKSIVYLYRWADSSTFRYRVYNMCEMMNKTNSLTATYFFLDELDVVSSYLDHIDTVVLARIEWSIDIDTLFCKLFAKKIPVYYEIDDLVYDIAKVPMIMNHVGAQMSELNVEHWFSKVSRIGLAASYCERYITTNKFLADQLSAHFKKSVDVIPNFINEKQKEISDTLWDLKKDTSFYDNEKIMLGYFSGSPTHNNDFSQISPALCEIMDKNKNIVLRIVGLLTLPENLNAECIPLQNYLDLQVKIAECDINLVPLMVDTFANSKSEIKFFEAGIVGVPTAASPAYVYRQHIQNGHNGYVVNPGEWASTLEKMIENRRDTSIGHAAREYAAHHYYGEEILTSIERVFQR